jgi:hypothetical protein
MKRLLATVVLLAAMAGWISVPRPGDGTALAAASRRATLATFAGRWFGHTRSLTITRRGHARESIYDGCCDHVIDLRFRLSRVRGTSNKASALARVTAVHVFDPSSFTPAKPAPKVGERRRLRLRNGVITEPFTHTVFCNEQAPIGSCGA